MDRLASSGVSSVDRAARRAWTWAKPSTFRVLVMVKPGGSCGHGVLLAELPDIVAGTWAKT